MSSNFCRDLFHLAPWNNYLRFTSCNIIFVNTYVPRSQTRKFQRIWNGWALTRRWALTRENTVSSIGWRDWRFSDSSGSASQPLLPPASRPQSLTSALRSPSPPLWCCHLSQCCIESQRCECKVKSGIKGGGVVLAWTMGQLWPWSCSNFALTPEILPVLDLVCVCVHWCWLIPSYLLFSFCSTLIYL